MMGIEKITLSLYDRSMCYTLYIIRWEKKSSPRPYFLDIIFSKEILYDAYREGFINWNMYQKALDKVSTNMHRNWMFEQGSEKIDYEQFQRSR